MLQIIKTLMLDFLDTPLETGVTRDVKIEPVSGKATICVGVRRGGKSTYMFQIMKKLIDKGVPKENILYLNFFDDRLHNLQHDNLNLITEAYFSLYPEKKNTEKVYCFFDEIQVVSGWESFVDRLLRSENCEIYITGSSAQLLSKEIATQMRGRALSWEIFPFSFKEYLDSKGIDSTEPLSTKKRLMVQKAFDSYWETGGFPEVLSVERNLRIKIHQEYFQSVLFRDLIDRHNISHPKALTDLGHKLVDNTASLYSINKLTGYLQSLGHKAPKSTISHFLEWFEDAYFLFSVRMYDASIARSNANPKKIYCIDHALVKSVSSGILLNSGHFLENIVFTALRRVSPHIYYYRTKTGKEVDFILQKEDRSKILIQVCESMENDNTRKREITALSEAMAELNLDSGIIVTRNESQRLEIDGKRMELIPVYLFLLNPS